MSKKCKAYSESKLGLGPADNRKAFYAGWDAALREALASTQPSQRSVKPWVGLTDEERDEIYNTHEPYADLKAIEAKLREKNEPREKNA